MKIIKFTQFKNDNNQAEHDIDVELTNNYGVKVEHIEYQFVIFDADGIAVYENSNSVSESVDPGKKIVINEAGYLSDGVPSAGHEAVSLKAIFRLFASKAINLGSITVPDLDGGVSSSLATIASEVLDEAVSIRIIRELPDESGRIGLLVEVLASNKLNNYVEFSELEARLVDAKGKELQTDSMRLPILPNCMAFYKPSFWGLKKNSLKGLKVELSLSLFQQIDSLKIESSQITSDSNTENGLDDSQHLSVEMNIQDLMLEINNIPEDNIYSFLAIYPSKKKNSPVIRSLFSYARKGNKVVFSCKGLTGFSSDFPSTQYGFIDISKNVMAVSFEECGSPEVSDNVFISRADVINGAGFFESEQLDESLKLSKAIRQLFVNIIDVQDEIYYVDDSDQAFYMVNDNFYKKHKKILDSENSWTQNGFSEKIYKAAESVLTTGTGFF